MDKKGIINKLRELGIETDNCYPKNSFPDQDSLEISVGLFKNEFAEDFYFYTKYNKTMYVLRKVEDISKFKEETFMNKKKWIVPLTECEVVWCDKPLEEVSLPDENFNMMTLRDYACIHLKVPKSNYPWLNELIKESK